jgi:hypothetical protein
MACVGKMLDNVAAVVKASKPDGLSNYHAVFDAVTSAVAAAARVDEVNFQFQPAFAKCERLPEGSCSLAYLIDQAERRTDCGVALFGSIFAAAQHRVSDTKQWKYTLRFDNNRYYTMIVGSSPVSACIRVYATTRPDEADEEDEEAERANKVSDHDTKGYQVSLFALDKDSKTVEVYVQIVDV